MKQVQTSVKLFVMLTAALLSANFLIAQTWQNIPGVVAQDIAVGKNGAVWCIGTNGAIYRRNGSSWETMPGGAVRIAVDPNGDAWVVNAGGQIYKYNSNTRNWELKIGNAKDIGIGADGSVWVTGGNQVPGGFEIYKWSGSGWNKIPGGALRIAVDPSGNAWVVNTLNNVFKYNGTTFEVKPGSVKDIGIGANGSIWCTGSDGRIYLWNGSNWDLKTGGATGVSVGPDGSAWVVNAGGQIYYSGQIGSGAITQSASTYIPPAKTSGKVRFRNKGNIAVTLYRTTANNEKTIVSEIAGNAAIEVDTKLGEMFTVEIKDEKVTHRSIYIVDLEEPVIIYGNVAMKDFGGYGLNFSQLNIDPNLYGVDTAVLNTKNLVTSMNKERIFERIDVTRGIDYETQSPYLVKVGFTYASMPLAVNSSKSKLSYGYSSFSSGWNVAGSGSFPVKGVDVSGGFGYGETQSIQSSNTDVYSYSRFQQLTHKVDVKPAMAYLDPIFIERVRKVNTASDADQLVADYGTHYPETVIYGGDLSSYIKMSSSDYSKAKSMNLDLKLAVEKSTPTTKAQKGYGKTETSAGSTYGGKLDFSYNESQEQRSLLEKSESQCKVIGGEYSSGGDFSVKEATAVPIAVTLKRIDDLIEPKIFKDDTDPAFLFKAKQLIKDAINRHIKAKVPATKPIQLPPPNTYIVTLNEMKVTGHIDDANSNTKGNVYGRVYADNTFKTPIPHLYDKFWSQSDYSQDFRFSPNNSRQVGSKLIFTQYPNPTTGKFDPFYLNLSADITEKDDIAWAPDGGRFNGGSGPIDLTSLNLQPGGPAASRSLDLSSSGTGSIRLSFSIQKEDNSMDMPDALQSWNVIPSSTDQSGTTSLQPVSEYEITLINAGGYAARFDVSYTVNGQSKSYTSGDVALGWRYKLAIPHDAKNIRVRGFYHDIAWKSIFDKTDVNPSNKCYKVTGTIWDAKQNNDCN